VVRDEVGSVGNSVGLGVASLCLVQFTDVLGVTVVVTALPRMLVDLHASPAAGSLIASGYAMFFSGLLMLGARLGDRFGHRRVILTGLFMFAVGATLGAAATTVAMLTAARCLQGAAAAGSVPSALRLLTTITSEGAQRRRAVAAWSAAGAAAGASGFVIGGLVTDLANWRFIFWGYLPVALVLAATIWREVPPDRKADRPPPLPLASSVLFTASVMGFVIATTLLPQKNKGPMGAVLLATVLVLAGAFIVVDRTAKAPLLPRSLLRERPLRQGAIGALLNTLTTSSTITLATLYLQNTRGLTPLTTAGVLLPFSLAVIAGSALAAPTLARYPPQRVIAAGLSAVAICDAALISSAAGAWTVPFTVVAGGVGIGLSSVAATNLGTSVAERDRATAAGVINTSAQLGTALGIAILLVVAAATTGIPEHDTAAPAPAWILAAAVSLSAAVGFACARQTAQQATNPSSPPMSPSSSKQKPP
jgi:MFS family permease